MYALGPGTICRRERIRCAPHRRRAVRFPSPPFPSRRTLLPGARAAMTTSDLHEPTGVLSPQSVDALQAAFRQYLRTGHAEAEFRRAMQLASAEAGARQLTAD